LKLNLKHFNLDDATNFFKKVGKIVVCLVVYVDDMLIARNNESYIASIKNELKKCFEMTHLGHLHYVKDIGSVAKRVLKYLKGTQDFGLKYSKVDDFNLIGYFNSDFVGDKENGVSTSGYLMSLGSTVVSWRSHKQSIPTDSTIEAEYVVVAEATKEIVWLRKILEYL
jgi:hypothetical protein